jgi:hypothetical protein
MYLLLRVVSTSVSWFILGPSHPWRGMIVAWGTMSIVPAVPASAIVRRLPHQWFRVPDGLLSLEHGAQASFIAHGICFAMHVLLAVLALFSKHPWSGALWVLLPGLVVHLYPVLLQRSTMLRLQPLLQKMRPADCVGY